MIMVCKMCFCLGLVFWDMIWVELMRLELMILNHHFSPRTNSFWVRTDWLVSINNKNDLWQHVPVWCSMGAIHIWVTMTSSIHTKTSQTFFDPIWMNGLWSYAMSCSSIISKNKVGLINFHLFTFNPKLFCPFVYLKNLVLVWLLAATAHQRLWQVRDWVFPRKQDDSGYSAPKPIMINGVTWHGVPTWRIIPISKWLITMVSKSPKWGYSPSKWPKWLINRGY